MEIALLIIFAIAWTIYSEMQKKEREKEEREEREIIARGREEEKRRKDAEAIADAIVRRQKNDSNAD